ncbi:MAG TPA: carbohydrate ABC transporter permease, partial [bacterium]|nr:carbohydrate ABC transporter permease [bacterium]
VVLLIPLFLVMARLHLVDTYLGLILALVTFNLPFVTWLLRGYFLGLPKELEDAARIDGCGRFGVLFRIALPLAAPGVAAVATLSMVNSWNDFLFAFVLINNDARKVLATGLASYGASNNDYTALFAMATLTTVPIVALFVLFQRYLVGGLAAGSVKA